MGKCSGVSRGEETFFTLEKISYIPRSGWLDSLVPGLGDTTELSCLGTESEWLMWIKTPIL